MNSRVSWSRVGTMLAVGAINLVFAVSMSAQVEKETATTHGASTKEVSVESGEVVLVEGNDLIIRNDQGQIVHFPNVPNSTKFHVGGQELSVHDLKPGMKLQRTITTTTTPQTITTIQTVTGRVCYVSPPNSLILTLENGTNQQFKIPQDQKFNVDGKMVDAFDLEKGMQISATKIVEVPMTVTTQQKSVTGTMPPPSPTLPVDAPLLVAEGEPTAAPSNTETPAAPANPTPATATASYFPWIGLAVLVLVVLFAIMFIRAKSKT